MAGWQLGLQKAAVASELGGGEAVLGHMLVEAAGAPVCSLN